jgi:RNA polymerase sigma-70 factor (ECF subfamily)
MPAREAVPLLMHQYGDRIYRLGLRVCSGSAEAEDLVQETMVQALKSWNRFSGAAQPYTWLFRIAVRTCRRMHRKRAGEPERFLPLDELSGFGDGAALQRQSPPDAAAPDEDHAEREVRRRLDAALHHIPQPFRIALVLKDIADFSLDEVAEILGIQAATVKTRIHRGRLHLRRALSVYGVFDPLPPTTVPRRVCLDLLQAKLEAMDRGADFPFPHTEMCDRCFALFRSLDLAQDACASLRDGPVPDTLRERLRALLAEV